MENQFDITETHMKKLKLDNVLGVLDADNNNLTDMWNLYKSLSGQYLDLGLPSLRMPHVTGRHSTSEGCHY
eukprot:11542706-Prorocentrum_lima.AAC.1